MQKLQILAFTIALILLSPVIIAVDDVELSVSSNDLSIYSGETATVEMTVRNNQGKADIFSVVVVPSFLSKIAAFPETAATNLPLSAQSSVTVKMFFSVQPQAEETISPALFKIFVTSSQNENITANKTVQVAVLRTSPVYLSEARISQSAFSPEETLEINGVITNTRSTPSDTYRLQVAIKKSNALIKSFDETISEILGRSSKTILTAYTFDRYAEPGVYSINVNLRDNLNTLISSKSLDIKVNEVNKTSSQVTQDFKILSVVKTVKVQNVGNVPTSVSLKETVPSFAQDWVVIETDPTFVNFVGNSVVYEWLASLTPGQEATIKYQINLWGVWIGLLIIFGLVYFAFKFVFTPSVTKKVRSHKLAKGSEIIVTLELKNHSLNEVKDIVVTDVTPQLTEVVQKFDTLKPVIRKTAEGTELSWRLDSLKIAEERVINYRIKPTVDVLGSLELPSSTMRFYDSKRVKRFVVSGAVSVGK